MVQLLAGYWTSAGNVRPGRTEDASPVALRRRLRAVSAAGFGGVGLRHDDLEAVERENGWAELRSTLADLELGIVELEYLNNWWGVEQPEPVIARRNLLFTAARELGARHIKAGLGDRATDGDVDRDILVAGIQSLAEDARASETMVAIEPTAYSILPGLMDVSSLLDEACEPAVGLLLDIWHVYRSGVPFSQLAAELSERHIIAAELCDGSADCIGTLYDDTFDRRQLCGDGDFDVPAFVAAVRGLGFEGPWGVEVMSDVVRSLPLTPSVLEAFVTTRDAVEEGYRGIEKEMIL